MKAASGLNAVLGGEWKGFDTIEKFSIDAIANAHEFVEGSSRKGRVVVEI